MEEETIVYLIMFVVSLISIGLISVYALKLRRLDPRYVKEKVKMYQDLADEYKDEAKSWKGKYNQTKAAPTFEGDIDDITSLIPNIIGSFADFLPKKLQPFMQNKEIQGALIKKVLENPEKFTSIIGNLISKKNKGEGNAAGPTPDSISV